MLTLTRETVQLANGFARAELNIARPSITSLAGDYQGGGRYGELLTADGFRLEREDADGTVHASTDAVQPTKLTVLSNTTDLVSVRLDGIVDSVDSPLARESWTVSLAAGSRGVELVTEGGLVRDATARAVRHGLYLRRASNVSSPLSINALFSRGVVQMRGAKVSSFFATNDTALRVFALGHGTGALDLTTRHNTSHAVTVLLSSSSGSPYSAGVQEVLAGGFAPLDKWCAGWSGQAGRPLTRGGGWRTSSTLSPNDRPFPVGGVPVGASLGGRDLEAMLTGIYGSAVGALTTFDNEVKAGVRVAQIATTIARPDRGYQGHYNFFDPDNYLTLSALIYSADPYLQAQAKAVIERSGAFLTKGGQLPHHFDIDKPHYTALSGATQTGPNTFWTLAALQYARNAGDLDWLKGYMPTLRLAANFCFSLIEPASQLMLAPGSLMIDVFIRANFTTDSNAMVVGFLREFAEAEAAVGNATGAKALLQQADAVAAALNNRLWASGDGGDDHYITQLNPDGSTRDFVDYDANLIAVAHGVAGGSNASNGRAAKVLARVDAGRCSAASGGGPQFVSER